MPRIKSTLFRPIPGASYIAVNTKTSEKVICHVLKPVDESMYGRVRSGRSCRRGDEFFKIFINNNVHKMNNSLDNGTCLSEDKLWEFTNDRPSLGTRKASIKNAKVKKTIKKQNIVTKITKTKNIEFISHEALSKII
jgi:hypothetical protein